jgi:hypothetical protein
MSWENIIKRKKTDEGINIEEINIYDNFVKSLADSLIRNELEDHLSRTTLDDQQYKDHEVALKEVLYDDLLNNISFRLGKAIHEVVFEEGEIQDSNSENVTSSGIFVLIEAIDKNMKELESRNLEW